MGQGIITSFPQMLAEELDTPLATVDIKLGDTAECPYDMGTWGSMSTRSFRSGAARGGGGSEGRSAFPRGGQTESAAGKSRREGRRHL